TPDETFPATATRVQAALGMTKGAAFDLQAVCAGFVYGMSVADSMIKNGLAATALVIGAETFSRILDWNDRGTCVLFGDGAGAIVLKAEQGTGTSADRGVLANALHSDGRQHDILYVDGGPSSTGKDGRAKKSDLFLAAGSGGGWVGRASLIRRWGRIEPKALKLKPSPRPRKKGTIQVPPLSS